MHNPVFSFHGIPNTTRLILYLYAPGGSKPMGLKVMLIWASLSPTLSAVSGISAHLGKHLVPEQLRE